MIYRGGMRVAIVTPTYNERENVGELIARLAAAVPGATVVVVDDGSPDGTADAVDEVARERPGVHLLRRPGKAGLASAYVTGFHLALALGAERIVQIDADLSHDPADVPRLLAEPADLVLGSRHVPGGGTRDWSLHRRILSRFGSAYARACLGLPQRDLTGGFKAWRAAPLRRVLSRPLLADGYAFQVETTQRAVRAGCSVVEVPIVFTERARGASKMRLPIALEAALLVPALRLARGGPR
ncbi:polyprenol monophosphomannose synthase [Myxococcota bacterium]|nr:polyprenol monophosphomannose synthase [Myxococcota bacterium]